MSRTKFLSLFMLLIAGRVLALNAATSDRKNDIQRKLNSALAAQKDIQEIQSQIDDKRNGPRIIQALTERKQALMKQRDLAYNTAARQTLLAYGLVGADEDLKPRMPSGKTVYPDFNGRQVSWIVVYKDKEIRTVLRNSGKRDRVAGGSGESGGVTYADGVTTLYGTYESPEELVLLLRHEQLHFEQLTTKDVGDKLSKNECELAVRNTLLRELSSFGFSREAEFAVQAKLRAQIQTYQTAVNEEKSLLGRIRRIGKPDEPIALEAHSSGEYSALAKAADDFDSQAAEAERVLIAQAKKNKEAEESRELQEEFQRRIDALPPPIAVRAGRPGEHPEGYVPAVPTRPQNVAPIVAGRPPISGLSFKYIASRACSAPPQAVDREMASMDWALFQKEKIDERIADGLSACERRVVLRLIALGRTWRPGVVIGANEVLAAAAEPSSGGRGGFVPPTQDHDPVWGKVGPIIGR